MSYSKEHWRKAITKLLELTSKNEIKWQPSELYQGDTWTTVDRSLMAVRNNKFYVVSQTRKKYFLDEAEYVWESDFNLSIFEKDGSQDLTRIASSPSINSLPALFEAAEGNLAFNRNALDDLLE